MKISFPFSIFKRKYSAIIHPTAKIYSKYCIENNLKIAESILVGANTHIKGQLLTFGHGGKIEIGDYCYVGEQSHIWSAQSISIGNRVLIAHNVNIFDSLTHPIDPAKRHQQFKNIITTGHPLTIDLEEKPVLIENDVWISCMAIILPGVRIGEGSIVAAGSVVTKDIEPGCLVGGNPATVIKRILF